MIKIGDFSKLARVSVKTLRHYDQLGLLHPAWVDRYSSYRYYTAAQLPRLNHILALKDLGFTLEQVRQLLVDDLPGSQLRGMLRLKQSELERLIQAEQMRLERVEERLRQIEQEGCFPIYEVLVKPAPSQQVIGLRRILPSYQHLAQLFGELGQYLHSQGWQYQADTRLAIYYDLEYCEQGVDVESAVPFLKALPGSSQLVSHQLPAVESMACTVHQGEYGLLPEAYKALMTWIENHGYRLCGPNRDLYLQGPEDPVTEVQFPVEVKPVPFFFSQNQEKTKMEPRIVSRPAFTAVGVEYYGKNENDEIADMWQRFNPRIQEIQNIIDGAFGLCLPADESGAFKYLAGMAVSEAERVPEGMLVWQVPEQTYAVFPCTLPTLRETYRYAFETWLPASGYTYTQGPDFEYYDEKFDPQDPQNSTFQIYVPVN